MGASRLVRGIVSAVIFMVFYYMILFPAIVPAAQSYTHAFVQDNADMFKFQFTTTEYFYNESAGELQSVQVVKTVDVGPFLVFTVDFILSFLPLLVLFGLIKKGWRW